MDSLILPVLVVSFSVAVTLIIVQDVFLRRFLAETPRIATQEDMDRFKAMARLGMYLTVIDLPFLAICIVGCFLIPGTYGTTGLVVVLGLNGLLILSGMAGKKREHRARNLPCDSAELRAEQKRVSDAWLHKLFPNF